jgi:hypothetical protein
VLQKLSTCNSDEKWEWKWGKEKGKEPLRRQNKTMMGTKLKSYKR